MTGVDDLWAGVVQVWLIRCDVGPAELARLACGLDDADRRRADGFVREVDRRRFVVAHGAARRILGRYLRIAPQRLRWEIGAFGKPLVDGLRMNLSHSADLAVLAVSATRDVGVDIQWCAPSLPARRMSGRFYPEAEARFVAAGRTSTEAVSRFVRLWARKEAVVKAAGGRITRGLGLPVGGPGRSRVVSGPPLPGPFRVCDVPAPSGFHAAVALRGPTRFEVTHRCFQPDHAAADNEDRPDFHRAPPLSGSPSTGTTGLAGDDCPQGASSVQ